VLAVALYAAAHATLLPLLLGVAVTTALTSLPLVVAAGHKRIDPFEPPVLVGVFYFIGFPLSAIMAVAFGREFDASQSLAWFPAALGVAAVGLVAWFAGYYWGPGEPLARTLPRLGRRWNGRRAALAVLVFGFLGWAAQLLSVVRGGYLHGFRTPISGQWSTTVAWVASFALVGLAAAAVRHYQFVRIGKPSRVWATVFVAAFALELAYAVPSGWRAPVLETLLLPLVVANYVWGRVRWTLIITVGLLGAFVIFPVLEAYRADLSSAAALSGRHPSTASVAELRQAAASAAGDLVRLKTIAYASSSLRTTVARLGMVQIVAAIVRLTPAVWPFEYGGTLQAFVVSLAPPRFLVQKPTVAVGGQAFAHRYHLIQPGDTVTSVGLTRVGELYLDFWLAGVVGGMWAEGVLCRLVYAYLVGIAPASPSGVLLYALFLLSFLEFTAFADYALMLKIFVVLIPALVWISIRRPVAAHS